MPRPLRLLLALVAAPALAASLVTAPPARAHEEREASFPSGKGERPRFLGYDNDRARVVCRRDSAERVAALPAGRMKQISREMLDDCRFRSIQSAIDSVRRPRTSVYVLPGVYRERKRATAPRSDYCSNLGSESQDPLAASSYIGSVSEPGETPEAGAEDAQAEDGSDPVALSYADQRRCRTNLNLISVFGDRTPRNGSIACDSRFCGLQVVGTGSSKGDVLIDNGFQKLNAFRADRAGGIVIRRLTVQQAEFNAIYVLETDGFLLDQVVTRGNDEYGILAFASDHGLIQRTNNYYNGDSGIYPGSASDLNGQNQSFTPRRYAIEIRRNRSHHNALGYSGTAGNSVYAHHNRFFRNATGIVTDSLFPGHPGLPQDHARWSRNRIYSNNTNYYERHVQTGDCAKPLEERGYLQGTVCPVIPTAVGVGVMIAGGNFNSTDHNWIYDNWEYGTMQFWVPAPLRDEMDPDKLYDTSHHNHTVRNRMGITPEGRIKHNGLDHWWDDEGEGNCWTNNTYSRGRRTDNFTVDPPTCAEGGSLFTPGTSAYKDSGFLSCSQYDRDDPALRDPAGCEWFESPSRPQSDGGSALRGGADGRAGADVRRDDTRTQVVPPLATLVVALGALLLARRRRGRA